MIKKYSLVFIALLCLIVSSFGQATLPLARATWNGAAPVGWIDSGTGSYTTTFACSGNNGGRLDDSGDYYQVFFDSAPNQLSFSIKISGSATSSLLVQESPDASAWTTIVNNTNLPTSCTTYNFNLNNSSRYVRWTYTKIAQNLTIDDVSITSGAPAPEIQLVDTTATNQNCGFTINYGTQALSSNTDLTLDIENVGSADLDITSFGITGDYTIISPATPLTITSGNSQTVTVRFTPTVNGTRNGVLTINNNDSNEGTCLVNLIGVGFTPAPEIDVERNTFASITSGNAPNGGNNTIFASTVIGNSTAPKTYYIRNEGTANLTISNITSSNITEFPVITNPAPITLLPNEFVAFEITFSPTGVGTRNSTISITNNDSNENPYFINVQGNGDCASGTLTFLPDNGPVGTVVNITTSGNDFGGSTTATLSGISATVVVISSNEIEVTIPAGSSTGSIEVNDDLGCLSSGLFTVIDELISSCEGNSGLTPTNLFISEVTDKGTGSHSYVEIYNGTGAAIPLNTYELRIHNNGAANATTTIPLIGTPTTIANNGIIVIAFGGSNANDPEGGYTADFFSGGGG